jgi:charged multivesicular body protein 4
MQRVLDILFGRPAPKQSAKIVAMDVLPTLQSLQMQESTMDKRIKHLEACLRAGDKAKAMNLLKQKGMLEDQMKQSQTMLNLLIQQRMALETAQLQYQTLKTIETTNTVLKDSHASLSTDKAESIMEDVHESIETQKEIGQILAQPLPGQQEIDDAASKELEALMEKVHPTPTHNPLTSLPSGPSVPAAPVSSSEHELASLESDERVALPA